MCRFVAYKGKPLLMAELLVKSANSLVFQSISSSQRAEPVNGDGFGVGWYPLHSDPEPGVFVSVEPAWSNRNLDELSKKIVTGCFFAHVRDATPGMPVTQLNCHPFKWENILFMHNGSLAGYRDERRRYLEVLSDAAFDLIQGNTDTEFCFAYFLDKLGFRERVAPEEIAYA
ncbi:MAG: class II glutamine amidotransferase, partial [Sphingomonadales bacterium]